MANQGSQARLTTFIFVAGKAKARGQPGEGHTFLVLARSTALRLNNGSSTNRDRAERDGLVQSGVLVPDTRDPDLLKFATDHLFSSATAAAGVINDGNVSGPQAWKDPATKKTLKDYWSR